jgi:hypothetical protein
MRKGSVQQTFVTVEDVIGDVVCLRGTHPQMREYRAAVAVESINFALKSEREQEAILAAYAAFLNGLQFPIQVLAQIRPLALQPYLDHVRMERARAREQEIIVEATTVWDQLTDEYLSFVAGLAEERTILERRFFVMVPADTATADRGSDPLDVLRRVTSQVFQRRKADPSTRSDFVLARQQLALRVDVVITELGRMGVVAARLGNVALLELCAHALAPDRAVAHPFHADDLARVGLPPETRPVTPCADAVEILQWEQEYALNALLGMQEAMR